ncbi:MAG: hypothetical protein AB1578_01890 [Thermodesulfobacteriota bacterium]
MTRFRAPSPIAWLAVLSMLLLGAALPHRPCGGGCCAAPVAVHPGAEPHSCCCDTAPVPCDLEQAPVQDFPDSAVTAVPRVDAPAHAPVLGSIDSSAVPASPVGSLAHARPCAQGPPGPIYLRHLALLC